MASSERRKEAQSARARLAEERARAEQAAKRRRTIGIAAAVAAVILAIIGVMVVVSMNRPSTPTSNPSASADQLGDGTFVNSMLNVQAASLDAVGAGSLTTIAAKAIPDGQPVLVDGKSRVLYIGAEYCPYCALERWSLTIALARFGTVDGLKPQLSGPNEGPASNIPTVSYGSMKYTSQYLTFTAYETEDRLGQPLETVPASDLALQTTYGQGKAIPFTYWGTGAQLGASHAEYKLMAGKSGADVAVQLADTTSPTAKVVLGAANVHTAQFCKLTGQQPAAVCASAGVVAAAKVLG